MAQSMFDFDSLSSDYKVHAVYITYMFQTSCVSAAVLDTGGEGVNERVLAS